MNFLWTHTALATADTAREFYSSPEWHNSGGDRTWLAPEVDFFFPNYPDLSGYFQQRELDPGNYQVQKSQSRTELVNRLAVTQSRTRQRVELEITKSVGPAPNPVRYEPGLSTLEGIEYAGYTLQCSLRLVSGNAEQTPVGLWNLLQMPHGGDLLIPTRTTAAPNKLFGTIPEGDLTVHDRLVRYKMRAASEQKVGVRAAASTGRVGYLYPVEGQLALIVRNFFVDLSGEYVDVPWKNPAEFGCGVQACNVNSQLGSFSELEYHAPAIGRGTGADHCTDTSQVWAFRGPLPQIRQLMSALLGVEA
jgi:hypothetical protein